MAHANIKFVKAARLEELEKTLLCRSIADTTRKIVERLTDTKASSREFFLGLWRFSIKLACKIWK